jgi:hypothetical protein
MSSTSCDTEPNSSLKNHLSFSKKELKASEEIILDSPNTTVSPTAK